MFKNIFALLIVCSLIIFISFFLVGAYKAHTVTNIYDNEVSALVTCKMIYEAIDTYRKVNGEYPTMLRTLGSATAPYICEDLVDGERRGYKYSFDQAPSGFYIMASPLEFGKTGRFYFHIDQSKRITVCDQKGQCFSENQYLGSVARVTPQGLIEE